MVLPALNLALRFVLELCALAAVAWWGFRTGSGAVRYLLGLGAPLLLAVVWGTFASPKAAVPLPLPGRLMVEAIVFGSAVAALVAAGRPGLGWVFAALVVVNRVLMLVWRQ